MGTVGTAVEQILLAANNAKLHGGLCLKIGRLVHKVIKIFPSLEAVQPRCMPGIQSLCALNLALDKATSLIQHCADCSKLYLIAEIVKEIEGTTFALEPPEKEVGNAIIALLQQSSGSCSNFSELEVFNQAADRLDIGSPRAMLKERRALKKLLDKAQAEEDQRKISVIIYFLHLLKKSTKRFSYDNLDYDSENSNARLQSSRRVASEANSGRKSNVSISGLPLVGWTTKESINNSDYTPMPPEEFRCPISLQLMFDPVVISSGQTYERMCIEKWFSDGHDTCPKTQQKLSHLSVTPNYCIKALITSWCEKYGIRVQDPLSQPTPTAPWASDMGFEILLHPNDDCKKDVKMIPSVDNIVACIVEEEDDNMPDSSNLSDSLHCDSPLSQENQESNENNDANAPSSYDIIDSDMIDRENFMKYETLLTSLMTPPLESQCQAAEKVKLILDDDDRACHYIDAKGIIPALVCFLRSANDASDIKAQQTGALALLSIARTDRNKGLILSAGTLPLLLDLIHSEAIEAALAVMLALSNLEENKSSFVASGAIPCLLELLESEDGHSQHSALNILYNLSSILWELSNAIPAWSVSKLVQLLGNSEHTDKCITILHNLAGSEEGRATIVRTEGCILAIAELLDTGNLEEQEQAVDILLLLCTNSFEYSHLVLREGVIPSLVTVSITGSPNGMEKAQKLLEYFREQRLRSYSWKPSQPVISISETFFDEDLSLGERSKSTKKASKKTHKGRSFFSKLRFLLPTCGRK
ncbi:U-box domain-containing protein 7 isoform X2 [Cryptomeria japonica]|uniref:U-box domain-containing protein 7 isoform X2 n=1 Tax=Cryptomeria japonica TaxID=3369 RepID=UPI0027D9E4FF|nr:U-box domain-containing protein 7 isoform X2 [Cryptomeria japonica]